MQVINWKFTEVRKEWPFKSANLFPGVTPSFQSFVPLSYMTKGTIDIINNGANVQPGEMVGSFKVTAVMETRPAKGVYPIEKDRPTFQRLDVYVR